MKESTPGSVVLIFLDFPKRFQSFSLGALRCLGIRGLVLACGSRKRGPKPESLAAQGPEGREGELTSALGDARSRKSAEHLARPTAGRGQKAHLESCSRGKRHRSHRELGKTCPEVQGRNSSSHLRLERRSDKAITASNGGIFSKRGLLGWEERAQGGSVSAPGVEHSRANSRRDRNSPAEQQSPAQPPQTSLSPKERFCQNASSRGQPLFKNLCLFGASQLPGARADSLPPLEDEVPRGAGSFSFHVLPHKAIPSLVCSDQRAGIISARGTLPSRTEESQMAPEDHFSPERSCSNTCNPFG